MKNRNTKMGSSPTRTLKEEGKEEERKTQELINLKYLEEIRTKHTY